MVNVFMSFFHVDLNLEMVKTSLEGLNEEGMADLGSQWESAEQDCVNNGNCNSKLNTRFFSTFA